MWAARNGHMSTVRLLLDEGADMSLSNDEGFTAEELTSDYDIEALLEVRILRAAAYLSQSKSALSAWLGRKQRVYVARRSSGSW
jgi:uncharacterized protein